MKRKVVVFAAVAALCCSATAMADGSWDPALDELILINGGQAFTQSSGQSITFEHWVEPNDNYVIGFSFAGVVQGITGTSTWASDTRLDILAPDGTAYDIGGFGAGGSPNPWDFDGGQSTNDGLYVHGLGSTFGDGEPAFVFPKIDKGGWWSFTFTQTFGSNVTWKGVSIVLHKQAVPAPGALALLGLAGLVGARRRRSA